MKTSKGKILWADDEIDHLKSHILFLEERGYIVTPVTNAEDAIALVRKKRFDLVLLDEMMDGMDGLQALTEIRLINPSIPVIMITKSEEENIMEEAIGGEIEDYLTKPVNPSQILSSCKRILEKKRIAREKITRDYTSEFGEITAMLSGPMRPEDWIDIHVKLSERELDLDRHPDLGLRQTLQDQRRECNHEFGRFIQEHYEDWVQDIGRPVMSLDVFKEFVLPFINNGEKVLFVIIDNLRLDQWLVIESLLYDLFSVTRSYHYSILPTATPYSRNALFAGLFPKDIKAMFPECWKQGLDSESSRNLYEAKLLNNQLKYHGVNLSPEPKYVKVLNAEEAKDVYRNVASYFTSMLTAMVFNFVDILAHRRSDSKILREIVPDETAYRSLTYTWFEHSWLFQILKSASEHKVKVVITSDHGSIRAMRGSTVYADRETSTNLRYKYGKGIRGDRKQIIEINEPSKYGLPSHGINTNFLIAKEDYYFVYPTNYHHYLALYRDSLQHGGISLEEMILPVVILEERR
jgi:CheY-like chemotaxis protein